MSDLPEVQFEVQIRPISGRRLRQQQQQQRRAVFIEPADLQEGGILNNRKRFNQLLPCRPYSELGPTAAESRPPKKLLRKDSEPIPTTTRSFQNFEAVNGESEPPATTEAEHQINASESSEPVALRRVLDAPVTIQLPFNQPELLPQPPSLSQGRSDCICGQLIPDSPRLQHSAGSATPDIPSWSTDRTASSFSSASSALRLDHHREQQQQQQQQQQQVHVVVHKHVHNQYHTQNYTNCVIHLPPQTGGPVE